MTKSTMISLAYFIGFAAICAGTIPAFRFMLNIGMNDYLIAFLWIILMVFGAMDDQPDALVNDMTDIDRIALVLSLAAIAYGIGRPCRLAGLYAVSDDVGQV